MLVTTTSSNTGTIAAPWTSAASPLTAWWHASISECIISPLFRYSICSKIPLFENYNMIYSCHHPFALSSKKTSISHDYNPLRILICAEFGSWYDSHSSYDMSWFVSTPYQVFDTCLSYIVYVFYMFFFCRTIHTNPFKLHFFCFFVSLCLLRAVN